MSLNSAPIVNGAEDPLGIGSNPVLDAFRRSPPSPPNDPIVNSASCQPGRGPDVRRSDPGTWLLDPIAAREHSLTRQIEQTQAEIDTLTARLGELSEQVEHLRISRKTLISLAEEDPAPAEPPPTVPITPPTGEKGHQLA